jgi:hypothetical protein
MTPPRLTPAAFIEATRIEVVGDQSNATVPFRLWDGQRTALEIMERERLIVFLKARQLGISWLVCGFALWLCTSLAGQPVLVYSQGQLEANELIRRTGFLYEQHQQRDRLPALTRDNTGLLAWANGSRMLSLAATRKAGRSFTAALAILDEWAFMAWPHETLAAVKPTIDAGGKLFIISSADGMGTAYHQHWQASTVGANGYTPVFLPWTARPDRGLGWRDQKLIEASGDTATISREYPANDIEAFTHAAGLVYAVWSDGPADGNVTEDAEYVNGGGPVVWGVDDGYAGRRDPKTGHFSADSHPRAFGLYQLRHDGTINRFAEHYAVKLLSDAHLTEVLALPYPRPAYAVVDKSAAELKGRLHVSQIYTRNSPADVTESIKEMRRAVAMDSNGRRRLRVHPRCKHFRAEMASYRYDPQTGKPIKQFDHGPDEARYLVWALRYEG